MYVVLKNGDIFSNTDYRLRTYPENVKKVLLEVFKINTPAFSKLSIRDGVLLIEGINKSATNKDLKSSKFEIKLEEDSNKETKNDVEKKSDDPKQASAKEDAATEKKESEDEPKKTSKKEESRSEKKEETTTHKRRRGRPRKKAE